MKTLTVLMLFAVSAGLAAEIIVGSPEVSGCNPMGIG
jgi:hypothetical protein